MVHPIDNLELETKTIMRGPSSVGTEKVQAEGPLVQDEEEKALFQ